MEKIPFKNKSTAHRRLGDEALVVNYRSSFFYNFNPVGAEIWEHCDGQHSVAQIAAELAEKYGITQEEATRDCQEFIDGLVGEGLLNWQEDR